MTMTSTGYFVMQLTRMSAASRRSTVSMPSAARPLSTLSCARLAVTMGAAISPKYQYLQGGGPGVQGQGEEGGCTKKLLAVLSH